MPKKMRILIVDDDPVVADSLAEFLDGEGYRTATAGDGSEAMELLNAAASGNGCDEGAFGLVVTDLNMPRYDGLALMREVHRKYPSIALLVITGFGKIESAVEAVKLGAVDYLTKPVVDDELRIAVSKAMRQHTLLAENKILRDQLTERYGIDNIVGGDHRMQKVYDLIEAVAESKTTVLISGESGTGKSMIARAVHTRSAQAAGPFITFACGSIPETLLESELFGHVKGAFTGADNDKSGKCLAADGGTLFIDEINSATPMLQLKLLRVLQEKQFEPVGSTKTINVDVRFVLAANEHLPELVAAGKFREDLYYRINVVNISLPPMRDRAGDVPALVEHFLAKYCKEAGKDRTVGEDAMAALTRYAWPGNVRELENALERAVVLSRNPVIEVSDLPDTIRAGENGQVVAAAPSGNGSNGHGLMIPALQGGWNPMPLSKALEEPEREILRAALLANDWNRQATARELDINRTTLYKKIKQFHLDEPA